MSEIHNFLLHMSEDERTLLFQMPFGQKVLMAFVISMSIIWGSLMKLFINSGSRLIGSLWARAKVIPLTERYQ
jgi:hypothetical protein